MEIYIKSEQVLTNHLRVKWNNNTTKDKDSSSAQSALHTLNCN